MSMREQDKLVVDVVSDTMCPWCFIGKRRLDRALVMIHDEVEPEIRWRPFQLDPTIPPEGMDRQAYLDKKFGREKAQEVYEQIKAAGDPEGIFFAFDQIEKSPNTLDSHRLIAWAEVGEQQDTVVDRLFERYFLEGDDIGDHSVLLEVAREADMPVDLVAEALASDKDMERIKQDIALAHQLGVEGVPTFVIDQRHVLVGAQPTETLAEALVQISQEPAFDPDDEGMG